MDKKDMKNRQTEKALSQLGALDADASDELAKANKLVEAASHKLLRMQRSIEHLYVTLEEPPLVVEETPPPKKDHNG